MRLLARGVVRQRDFMLLTVLASRWTSLNWRAHTPAVQALRRVGEQIRGWIIDATLPQALRDEVVAAYHQLAAEDAEKLAAAGRDVSPRKHMMAVAVRSSATAEDLPDASFAGQQETYLNVEGALRCLACCAARARKAHRLQRSLFPGA
jgi:pyruvate,water dikinase